MFSNICNSIASQLTANGHTVSIAESSTGGLIAANLLSVSGASSYFKGGSVIYTRESRHAFLDLDLRKVKALEPLTEPMAAEFAHAARLKARRDLGYRGAWCCRSQRHTLRPRSRNKCYRYQRADKCHAYGGDINSGPRGEHASLHRGGTRALQPDFAEHLR